MNVLIIGPDPSKKVMGGVVTHVNNLHKILLQKKRIIEILDTNFDENGKPYPMWRSLLLIRKGLYRQYDCIYINTSIVFSSMIKLGFILRYIAKSFKDSPAPEIIVQFHGGQLDKIGIFKKTLLIPWLSEVMLICTRLQFLTLKQKQTFSAWFPKTQKSLQLVFQPIEIQEHYEKKNFQDLKILFLSRIEKEKGIVEFLQAAKSLQAKSKVSFVIAGEGSQVKYVEEEAAKLKNVVYVGTVEGERKKTLLRECNVFCLLSEAEALPYALLENMSCGNIPVVTAVGRMPELVRKKGSGYVIPADSEELTNAILRLLSNQQMAAEMSCNAYQTMVDLQQEEASYDQCNCILSN